MTSLPKPALLRNAARAIHPQLPLNERQSQQLLGLLKNSFQKHLDTAHPPSEARSIIPLGSSINTTPDYSQASFPQRIEEVQRTSTSALIDDILSHPLLSAKPTPSSFIFGQHMEDAGMSTCVKTPKDMKQVKAWFQTQCASGMVDISVVRKYLDRAQWALAICNQADQRSQMKAIGVGSDVIHWLRQSSTLVSAEFLADHPLCSALTKCLTAEDRVEDLWRLLITRSDMQGDGSIAGAGMRRCQAVLRTWLHSSAWFGISIERRLQEFLECVNVMQIQLGHDSRDTPAASTLARIFKTSGNSLALCATVPGICVPLPLYNSFAESTTLWAGPHGIGRALLMLYHPQTPHADSVIGFMERINENTLRKMPGMMQRRVLQMCLDAAQYYLVHSNHENCSKLLTYARLHFARHLKEDPYTADYILGAATDSTSGNRPNRRAAWDTSISYGSFAIT